MHAFGKLEFQLYSCYTLGREGEDESMKLFHLSDLHIGLKLINRDLREDQEYIFQKIADYAKEEQPDVIVVAGDIYDKAIPSAEAYDLFDLFVGKLNEAVPKARIMMISGNHDSASRVNVYRSILQRHQIHMIGQPPTREEEYIEQVIIEDAYGEVHFYLLPFVKPSMVKQIVGEDEKGNNLSYDASVRKLIEREHVDSSVRNVLVSHQLYLPSGKNAEDIERMDNEIVTVGNIDQISADVLADFDYAALGHIHKSMKVGSDVYRYCGTPLACSVSEAEQTKGILMVELFEKGNVQIQVLPLEPLRKVKIVKGSLEEVLLKACDDYVRVVLTDKLECDYMDMRDRLNQAFPYLLEVHRENVRKNNYEKEAALEKEMDPFSLCCQFMSDLSEEEKELLGDVIHTVQGVK